MQIYSQYVEVSDALQQEKDENIRLKQYLDQILKVNLVQISDLVNGMKTFPLSWVFHFPYTAVLKWSIICYTACHFKDFFLFSCFFMSLLSSLLSLLCITFIIIWLSTRRNILIIDTVGNWGEGTSASTTEKRLWAGIKQCGSTVKETGFSSCGEQIFIYLYYILICELTCKWTITM